MMDYAFVEQSVLDWSRPLRAESIVIVPTMLTYPSNAAVMIYVEGGKSAFMLSDGGGAVATLVGAGGREVDGFSLLRDFCRSTDFRVTRSGWINLSGTVDEDKFLSGISNLAQFSKDAAAMLLRHFKPERSSDFRQAVEDELGKRFHEVLRKRGHIVGASNKEQTFDFLAPLGGGRILALDTVLPDSSSINGTLVAHLDVRAAAHSNVRQMVIYDENQGWKSSDLALLSMGTPPTAFGHFRDALERLAA